MMATLIKTPSMSSAAAKQLALKLDIHLAGAQPCSALGQGQRDYGSIANSKTYPEKLPGCFYLLFRILTNPTRRKAHVFCCYKGNTSSPNS